MASETPIPGNIGDRLAARLRALPWGAMALVSLYVSVASGIVVALQYQPDEAYHSVVMLDHLVPYGAFARSLHFYASQAFFLLFIAHFLAVMPHLAEMDRTEYWRLLAAMPVVILLLFTGYVLRADHTGASAGRIAEAIVLTIPFFGEILDKLFVAISSHGLHRIFLHHLVTLGLIFLLLVWRHLHRYRVAIGDYLWLVAALALFCAFVPAPVDADRLGASVITGPWFFLGIQEALRYLPTLLAGIALPASLLVALAFLPGKHQRPAYLFASLWLVVYAVLSLAGVR
jgi:ubiquinol-cytochrome c reductase cytochrome b subunit